MPTDFDKREEMEQRHSKLDQEVVSSEVFRESIDADFSAMLTVMDVGDLPTSASLRNDATFDDPEAALEWLGGWGVSLDDDGNPVPIGWVYAVRIELDDDQIEYQIYVDSDTNGD